MSSHRFEEVEKTCDNVIIIREGRIIEQADVQTLKKAKRKVFVIKPEEPEAARSLLELEGFAVKMAGDGSLEVLVTGEEVDRFIKTAARLTMLELDVKSQTLEDIFLQYYGGEGAVS